MKDKQYQVFDNDKPADCFNREVLECWQPSNYNDFETAVRYARAWLGRLADILPDNWDGKPVNYSGYGDKIEIREV